VSRDLIELTIFRKSGGALTKRIELGPDGTIKSDGSQCIMPRGSARRFTFGEIQEFANLIGALHADEALALGVLRDDLPAEVGVVTKSKLNGANHHGIISRSQEFLMYRPGRRSPVLLDFDTKGMPPSVAIALDDAGGFWSALVALVPELKDVARVERASTSAGLYDSRTGDGFAGSGGRHVYIIIKDGTDSERFLKTLHQRCWLAGLGWMMVGAGGQLLERSIVDRVCGTPERLAFEGSPVLEPPIAQDAASRQPVAAAGEPLDTRAVCAPLSVVDIARLDELRAKERHRLAAQSAKERELFVESQSHRLVERTGMDLRRARRTIQRQCEGVLLPDVELQFDDSQLVGMTVLDVLNDPARFEGETLADPLEGVEYGRCKARIMRRASGAVWIKSFAHGRADYELRLDYAAVRAVVERTARDDVPDTFVRLVLAADLRADEVAGLKHIAASRSDVGPQPLGAALRAAQQQEAAHRADEERDRRAAERRDPRPLLPVPARDAEFGPEMKTLNAVIGGDKSAEPPTRNANKAVAMACTIRVPSLHLLTSMEANLEHEPDEPSACLGAGGLKGAE
jgi:hypothetical protein